MHVEVWPEALPALPATPPTGIYTRGVGLHTGPGYTYKVQRKTNEDRTKQIKYS